MSKMSSDISSMTLMEMHTFDFFDFFFLKSNISQLPLCYGALIQCNAGNSHASSIP